LSLSNSEESAVQINAEAGGVHNNKMTAAVKSILAQKQSLTRFFSLSSVTWIAQVSAC